MKLENDVEITEIKVQKNPFDESEKLLTISTTGGNILELNKKSCEQHGIPMSPDIIGRTLNLVVQTIVGDSLVIENRKLKYDSLTQYGGVSSINVLKIQSDKTDSSPLSYPSFQLHFYLTEEEYQKYRALIKDRSLKLFKLTKLTLRK